MRALFFGAALGSLRLTLVSALTWVFLAVGVRTAFQADFLTLACRVAHAFRCDWTWSCFTLCFCSEYFCHGVLSKMKIVWWVELAYDYLSFSRSFAKVLILLRFYVRFALILTHFYKQRMLS